MRLETVQPFAIANLIRRASVFSPGRSGIVCGTGASQSSRSAGLGEGSVAAPIGAGLTGITVSGITVSGGGKTTSDRR